MRRERIKFLAEAVIGGQGLTSGHAHRDDIEKVIIKAVNERQAEIADWLLIVAGAQMDESKRILLRDASDELRNKPVID